MQWIKVFTDIFANPKIQLLLKERDGDTFFRVWIQLLTIAGQCMQDGKLMMSENNPMTIQDFATIMHKTNDKMENILNKLIHLEMIIFEGNTYIIKNWYKYQSIDKYEKILKQFKCQDIIRENVNTYYNNNRDYNDLYYLVNSPLAKAKGLSLHSNQYPD